MTNDKENTKYNLEERTAKFGEMLLISQTKFRKRQLSPISQIVRSEQA